MCYGLEKWKKEEMRVGLGFKEEKRYKVLKGEKEEKRWGLGFKEEKRTKEKRFKV
jgi:hypothetical protein